MPRCGATFDENSVPPSTRGDFRGVKKGFPGQPSRTHHDNPLKASRPLSFRVLSPFSKGDFQRRRFVPTCSGRLGLTAAHLQLPHRRLLRRSASRFQNAPRREAQPCFSNPDRRD